MLDSQNSFNPRSQVLYQTDRVPSVQEKLLSAITRFFTKLVTLVLQLPALQVSAIALARCILMTERSSEFTPNE